MSRFICAMSFVLLSTFLSSSAFAQSKPALDNAFAHVKHGQLYLTGQQGSQHTLGSHRGWANGQDARTVTKELVLQAQQAYRGLATNTGISKGDLDVAFAYIKQGQLILNGRTGPQHSLESHHNWARGQQRQTVVKAIDEELTALRDRTFDRL